MRSYTGGRARIEKEFPKPLIQFPARLRWQAGIPVETTNAQCIIPTSSRVSIPIITTGHCENLELRLKQNNSGATKSLRPYIPFKLICFEEFTTRVDAIQEYTKLFSNLM